jgi:hypothetical protein
VLERLQRLLAHAFLERAQVGEDLGRLAGDAQRGAGDQERQDQQEPPGAVDGIELERQEQLRPERAELVDVVHEPARPA